MEKRIDLDWINNRLVKIENIEEIAHKEVNNLDTLITELKRCYQLIDEQQRILHHHQACAECLGHRDELECIVVCECSDGFKEEASE